MHIYSVMSIAYLNNSIKSRDSVHFSSLGDQLALYFIPHCLDGMGVGADERHTLCCLVTNQAWQLPYRPRDTGIKERGEVSRCWMLVGLVMMRLKIITGPSVSSQFHSPAFHRVVTLERVRYSPVSLQTLCFQRESRNQDEPAQREKRVQTFFSCTWSFNLLRRPRGSRDTYGLRSCGSDGIHDGVHVEVALTGGSRANTEGLICHLDVDLGTNKLKWLWKFPYSAINKGLFHLLQFKKTPHHVHVIFYIIISSHTIKTE